MPTFGRRSSSTSPCRSSSSTRGRALRQRFFCAPARELGDPMLAAGDAIGGDRADVAARPGAQAHRGAEIHQRLRVGFDVARRQQRLGTRPERALDAPHRRRRRRCRRGARARASRCRRESRRARRRRTPRSPRRSSGRCRAAPRAPPHRAERRRHARATIACAARCSMMRAPVVAQAAPHARARARSARRRALATSGNAARKRSKYGMTVATCVCCSMISDSQMRYGSRVFCQGRSWRPARRCHAISPVAKRVTTIGRSAPGPACLASPRRQALARLGRRFGRRILGDDFLERAPAPPACRPARSGSSRC